MAATDLSSPPPNHFHLKLNHGEQEEEEQEQVVLQYNNKEDESPRQSCASVSSSSSSTSHEFSFMVSSLYTSPPTSHNNTFRETSSTTAIDLSPADEIFFHGHLLPLHLLSTSGHLSVPPPSSSTNSLDRFTLPTTGLLANPSNTTDSYIDQAAQDRALDNAEKPKSRSFSLFRNSIATAKPRKPPESQETHRDEYQNNQQNHHKNLNKVKFELSNAIKLVRSLLIFKQSSSSTPNNSRQRKSGIQMTRGQTFSYSGNLSPRSKSKQGADEALRGRFSAPASMRSSPTNSGMFLEASGSNTSSSSSSDSTMEELQAAIQAAITHCKNSSIARCCSSS